MAKADDFKNLVTEIDAETTRIATRIDELVAKLQAGGMTEEEEAEVLNSLTATSNRLKSIGHDPNAPIPPVEG